MQEKRKLFRRIAGMLQARFADADLGQVKDPRSRRGQVWPWKTLVTATCVGMAAGCRSFLQTEELTEEMSRTVGRRFGLHRRVPDTTMRTPLMRVEPDEVRARLRAQVHAAWRRKALVPRTFPFGVVALDGKSTAIEAWDERYSQQQGNHGVVRLFTASLVSAPAAVCLDAAPIPSATNEMGHFCQAFDELMAAYGRGGLFRVVSTDAGSCSEDNARHVVETHGRDYLFGLKGPQVELNREARRLLARRGPQDADARTEDVSSTYVVTRRLYLTTEMAGFHGWAHLRTVLRVESETLDLRTGEVVPQDEDEVNRYFVSSLGVDALTPEQWLRLVRMHWRVENDCHHTWDTAFAEDDHPWVVSEPQGVVVLMLLRRLVYNALALFRSVSLRAEESRRTPWKTLLRWVRHTLLAARNEDLAGIRMREEAPPVGL